MGFLNVLFAAKEIISLSPNRLFKKMSDLEYNKQIGILNFALRNKVQEKTQNLLLSRA